MKLFLYRDMLEAWRGYKFLWLPIVFIVLGVTDPLSIYYMDDILQAVGNVPEGFTMAMPEMTPLDLVASAISQYQFIGVAIIVAISATLISRERANGTATLIYVRPIAFSAYYVSKFIVLSTVVLCSLLCGIMANSYYTHILFGSPNIKAVFFMASMYMLWLLFIMAIALTASALFKPVVAITSAFIIVFGGMVINTVVGAFWQITPWKLVTYTLAIAQGEAVTVEFYGTVVLTVLVTIAIIALGIWASAKRTGLAKI